eukprot:Gb_07715 [translate_table: standard]
MITLERFGSIFLNRNLKFSVCLYNLKLLFKRELVGQSNV